MSDLTAKPSMALAFLHQRHLDHHRPSRICPGSETCQEVFYLGIIEELMDDYDAFRRRRAAASNEADELRACLAALESPGP